jgi:hypothetical protein
MATFPDVTVSFAYGGSSINDPSGLGMFVLDRSTLGPTGTDVLGSFGWTDLPQDDVLAVTVRQAGDELSSPAPGTATVTLDNATGAYDWINGSQLSLGLPVWIRATWASTTYGWFRGVIDDLDLDAAYGRTVTVSCIDALEVLGRAKLDTIASQFDNDLSGTRVGRILDAADWPTSLRSVDAGLSNLQATTYGDYALPLLAKVTDTEFGVLYVDGDGKVVFGDRLHVYTATRSLSVQATITDVGTDVDMIDLTVSRSRSTVFTSAAVTRDGGTQQTYTDAAAVASQGLRAFSGAAGSQLRSDSDAANLASWIVGRYKHQKDEAQSVRIDATAQGMWATLLPLRLYDRIRIIRDYGPATIDLQLLIQGIEITVTAGATWEWTLTTRNTDVFSPFILDTSTLDSKQLT